MVSITFTMGLILPFLTFISVAIVHGQQVEKQGSVMGFPHLGTEGRFFMEGKRSGNSLSPGLIPFPRIGRAKDLHEVKRQLIPFPRIGKRPYWRVPMDPYLYEYEEYMSPMVETPTILSSSSSSSGPGELSGIEEIENEKRSTTNNNGGMWFGPRLGKRKKRSIVEADNSAEGKSRETMDTTTLLKILHNFNWAIIPIKERRNFTPRLGRSSDEIGGGIHHRSQPYTPRLGRSREVVSNELPSDDDQVSNSRFSRGGGGGERAEHGKPTTTPTEDPSIGVPFQPRLGRDHIQPRLGRSGETDRD